MLISEFILGLAISFLGDSFTTFDGYVTPDTNLCWYSTWKHDTNDVTKVEQTWWYQVMTKMNGQLEENNSYSGSTVGYKTLYWPPEVPMHRSTTFVERCINVGNPDIIFLFGGINDAGSGCEMGDYQYTFSFSSDSAKTATLMAFRPAYAYVLTTLMQQHPHARIYALNHWYPQNGPDSVNVSITEICSHLQIPCIPICLRKNEYSEWHANKKGMRHIAYQVLSAIRHESK